MTLAMGAFGPPLQLKYNGLVLHVQQNFDFELKCLIIYNIGYFHLVFYNREADDS